MSTALHPRLLLLMLAARASFTGVRPVQSCKPGAYKGNACQCCHVPVLKFLILTRSPTCSFRTGLENDAAGLAQNLTRSDRLLLFRFLLHPP